MIHPDPDELTEVPLLAGLAPAARDALAAAFEVDVHAPGHTVVREGQSGYAFYVIASGAAVVSVDGQVVRHLGEHDFFGEAAIMGDGRRTATVAALTPLTVWVLFGTRFHALQVDHPNVATQLQAAMRERLAAG